MCTDQFKVALWLWNVDITGTLAKSCDLNIGEQSEFPVRVLTEH